MVSGVKNWDMLVCFLATGVWFFKLSAGEEAINAGWALVRRGVPVLRELGVAGNPAREPLEGSRGELEEPEGLVWEPLPMLGPPADTIVIESFLLHFLTGFAFLDDMRGAERARARARSLLFGFSPKISSLAGVGMIF